VGSVVRGGTGGCGAGGSREREVAILLPCELCGKPQDPGVRLVSDDAEVRVQVPFAASDHDEPEPDFAVVPVSTDRAVHPGRAHLIVEVANTSPRKDRIVKGAIYALAGVPEFWLVDVQRRLVEVYREPLGDHYTASHLARPGDRIEVQGLPGRFVAVSDVFPV